eukprot:TRINITY_DN4383_c0_g1_i1.p1 TRINITY_DN4383_c0_g1~~TRINITY_DN4383_c0_g1_i1.p1  ORF type:complete len:176 (+),score=26.62 TRINITY_DN4383_c0_g1_i1:379-906(+)
MMIKPPIGAAPHNTNVPPSQASASLQHLRGALQGANSVVTPPAPLITTAPHYVIPTLSNGLPNSSSVIQFSKWPSHLPQFPMTHTMPFITPHPPPNIPNPNDNVSAPKHIPSPPLPAENSPVNVVSGKMLPSPPSQSSSGFRGSDGGRNSHSNEGRHGRNGFLILMDFRLQRYLH